MKERITAAANGIGNQNTNIVRHNPGVVWQISGWIGRPFRCRLKILPTIAGLIFLALGHCQCERLALAQQGAPEMIDGAVVARDTRALSLFSRDLHIAAEVAGVLQSVDVREGDRIHVGDRLASFQDHQARLECELAEQQLKLAQQRARNPVDQEYARLTLELADRKLARAKQADQAFSQSELDQLDFDSRRSDLVMEQAVQDSLLREAEVATAKARRDLAKHHRDRHQLDSPTDGVVVEVLERPGEFVSVGQPLLRCVRLRVMRISAAIPLEQIARVKRGSPVSFVPAQSSDDIFLGRVTFVSPETFGEIQTVKVVAEVANPEGRLRAKVDGVLTIFESP